MQIQQMISQTNLPLFHIQCFNFHYRRLKFTFHFHFRKQHLIPSASSLCSTIHQKIFHRIQLKKIHFYFLINNYQKEALIIFIFIVLYILLHRLQQACSLKRESPKDTIIAFTFIVFFSLTFTFIAACSAKRLCSNFLKKSPPRSYCYFHFHFHCIALTFTFIAAAYFVFPLQSSSI